MNCIHVALCVLTFRQASIGMFRTSIANMAYQDETWALLDIENSQSLSFCHSQHLHGGVRLMRKPSLHISANDGFMPPVDALGQRSGGAFCLKTERLLRWRSKI